MQSLQGSMAARHPRVCAVAATGSTATVAGAGRNRAPALTLTPIRTHSCSYQQTAAVLAYSSHSSQHSRHHSPHPTARCSSCSPTNAPTHFPASSFATPMHQCALSLHPRPFLTPPPDPHCHTPPPPTHRATSGSRLMCRQPWTIMRQKSSCQAQLRCLMRLSL